MYFLYLYIINYPKNGAELRKQKKNVDEIFEVYLTPDKRRHWQNQSTIQIFDGLTIRLEVGLFLVIYSILCSKNKLQAPPQSSPFVSGTWSLSTPSFCVHTLSENWDALIASSIDRKMASWPMMSMNFATINFSNTSVLGFTKPICKGDDQRHIH